MTNIKNFDSSLFSIDQVLLKKKMLKYFKNYLYLIFNSLDAYIEYNTTEDDNKTKYFVFVSTDKNKEALKN